MSDQIDELLADEQARLTKELKELEKWLTESKTILKLRLTRPGAFIWKPLCLRAVWVIARKRDNCFQN